MSTHNTAINTSFGESLLTTILFTAAWLMGFPSIARVVTRLVVGSLVLWGALTFFGALGDVLYGVAHPMQPAAVVASIAGR